MQIYPLSTCSMITHPAITKVKIQSDSFFIKRVCSTTLHRLCTQHKKPLWIILWNVEGENNIFKYKFYYHRYGPRCLFHSRFCFLPSVVETISISTKNGLKWFYQDTLIMIKHILKLNFLCIIGQEILIALKNIMCVP